MKHSVILVGPRLWVFFATLTPLLVACGGGNKTCTDPDEPYLGARNGAALRIPEGLTKPDRAASLAIPDGGAAKGSAKSQAGRTSCIDEPPSYFRSAGPVARTPEEVVASWAQSWSSREADALLALYSTSFVAPTDAAGGSAAWLEQRREQVATGPVPDSKLENLHVEPIGSDRRVVSFVHRFGSNALRKELTLAREGASWRIVAEKVEEVK
jgi:hypothetical protein